jgi:hypothetical protein
MISLSDSCLRQQSGIVAYGSNSERAAIVAADRFFDKWLVRLAGNRLRVGQQSAVGS